MASLVKAGPIVASVALLLLAFPPFNLGFLVFVALVPWLLSLRETTGKGAFRSGFLIGFLYMVGQLYWLQPLTAKWTGSLALSVVPLVLGPLVVAPFFAFAGWLIFHAQQRKLELLIPVVWAGSEVMRTYCPGLAFPWGQLATPLYPYPAMIQLAWIGGITLVSAWVMLGNLAVAKLMSGAGFLASRPLIFGFLLLAVAGSLRYNANPPGSPTSVTIGQLGLDLAFGDRDENWRRTGEIVQRFQDAALVQGSKLLVLPEGLVRGAASMPPPVPFGVRSEVPILFGGQRGDKEVFQSAYAFDGAWKAVDKTRLVVFGEYVPGRDFLPFLEAFNLPQGDLQAGEEVKSIQVGELNVGPLLCFEALFPDVARKQAANGAQILAVMALDDWYFGTAAPEQLMAASVFRAVETGLPVVRAAPLGYSIAVNANGEILARARLRETIPMRVSVPVPAGPSPFSGGGIFELLAPLICVGLAGFALWERRRSAPPSDPEHRDTN